MDPVTCSMCEGAIPGKEIHLRTTCPSCGADLSALVRRRLATLLPAAPAPPQPASFATRAAWFALLTPCVGIVLNLFVRRGLGDTPQRMLLLETICSLVLLGGFILGVVAFFAGKDEEKGTRGRAIAGICLNGLLVSFVLLGILMRQKHDVSQNPTPNQSRTGWSYLSGK